MKQFLCDYIMLDLGACCAKWPVPQAWMSMSWRLTFVQSASIFQAHLCKLCNKATRTTSQTSELAITRYITLRLWPNLYRRREQEQLVEQEQHLQRNACVRQSQHRKSVSTTFAATPQVQNMIQFIIIISWPNAMFPKIIFDLHKMYCVL